MQKRKTINAINAAPHGITCPCDKCNEFWDEYIMRHTRHILYYRILKWTGLAVVFMLFIAWIIFHIYKAFLQ